MDPVKKIKLQTPRNGSDLGPVLFEKTMGNKVATDYWSDLQSDVDREQMEGDREIIVAEEQGLWAWNSK